MNKFLVENLSRNSQKDSNKIVNIKVPLLLIINKIDLLDQEKLESEIDFWKLKVPNAEIWPISVKESFNIVKLLDRLVDYSNNDKFDKSTKLRVDYSRLKKIDLIKPCLKRYLASNVKTKFRKVEADEFMIATLLPVQRFKKQSDSHVFAKSRGMI